MASAKKLSGLKKPKAHPPYVEMISDAIVGLKERTGSSQYAIAKFIEEKQGAHLPPNFKKLLLVQLKKLVASGKLLKVKNSFKLAAMAKPSSVAATTTTRKAPAAAVKAPAKAKADGGVKPKGAATAKAKKGAATAKAKKVAAKPKAASKPKKSARTATVTSPGKKKVAAPSVQKVKKTPVKVVKKPKSIKSPAKKGKK